MNFSNIWFGLGIALLTIIVLGVVMFVFFYFFGQQVFYPNAMPLAGETSVLS